jgi:7-cyano-7-deazaguanine synthase in queuosine biosynthesis
MRPDSILNKRSVASDECIKVLWTGGWDSTFRVLYAAWVEGKRVEPHYIIDTGRRSSFCELRAISRIKDSLRMRNKEAYDRIGNLQITSGNEIPQDAEITDLWKQLKQKMDLARQYDWLARYAKSKNLTALELSIERDTFEKQDGIDVSLLLKAKVERTPSGSFRIKQGAGDGAELFARFEFPIREYTKVTMREAAKQHGFLEILEMSWFCHEPINGKPCGMCKPCVVVVAQGMGYRLTKKALFCCYLVQFVRKSPLLSKLKLPRQLYHWIRHGSAGPKVAQTGPVCSHM